MIVVRIGVILRTDPENLSGEMRVLNGWVVASLMFSGCVQMHASACL
ncbi:hypothetical protein [Methanococcoides burtonii]|nr:hypothetical protein [Methanococcoides burtonii]